MCQCTTTKYVACGVFFLIIGIVVVVVAIPVVASVEGALWDGVRDQRVVTNFTSKGYDQWASNDYKGASPQWFKIYVFNVTNPDEVENGAKPKLATVGPYFYDYHWNYFDVNFSKDGETVDVYQWEKYIFNKQKSGNLDPKKDVITFINVPYAGVRAQLANDDKWWQVLAFDLVASVGKASAFDRATVDQYIWGYESPFLEWLNATVGSFVPLNPFFSLQDNFTSHDEVRKSKGFPDTLKTGAKNMSDLNQFVRWKGKHVQDFWGTLEANTVTGANGYGFKTDIQQGEPLEIFVPEIFRHVTFVSNMTQTIKGIPMDIYFIDQTAFNNVTTHPEYYNFGPNGGTNLTEPMNETKNAPIPIFVTQPYFVGSDQKFLQDVEFLPPNDKPILEKHNTFVYVERTTGLTVQAYKRLQINIKVSGDIFLAPKMGDIYFPVAWFEEGGEIDDDQAQQWKDTVGLAKNVIFWLPVGSYIFGGLMAILVAVMFVMVYTHNNKHKGYSSLGKLN